MNSNQLQFIRWLFAMLVAAIASLPVVVAQDLERPIDARDVRLKGQIVIRRRGFDLWASGRVVGNDEIRDRYESALKSRVDSTVRLYGLSPEQKKKLEVAGRGDIKRMFDRAIEVGKRTALHAGAENGFPANEEDDPPHQLSTRGELFGEGSLFAKILKKTVTKEQSARFEKGAREAALHHHRATLQWVLGTWDQMLGLNSEQHRRLEALLIQETRPPRRFGEEDYFGVLFQISRLPGATLKPLFTETQWATLSVQLAEAKRREPMLKKDGYVPENDVAAAPAPDPANEPKEKREKKQG
jgi:hypothetical protein